jgi:hypothetical protein
MKMAKRQNLSLNPSKISGQCGRLLCCLAYENDLYQRGRRADIPEKPKSEPSNLGGLRDEMEEKPSRAVGALRESTLSDVMAEETDARSGPDATEPAAEPASSEPEEKPRKRSRSQGRRRRRRGRGGGGRPQDGPSKN